jgi:prolycopene isomerase
VPADADAYENLLCELEPAQAARIRDLIAALRAIGSLPAVGGLSPSAFVYARIWASYHLGGCFYFQGGGQALTDALVTVIEEHRGRVVLGAPVLSIRTEAGCIVAVETKHRGAFYAPCVISNASAPATYSTLLDDSSLAAQERAKAGTMPSWVSIH